MGRVIVLGSLNMDIVAGVETHPQVGETITGNSVAYFAGGKGLNQAIAARRASVDVEMIGCVGNDSNGKTLVGFLDDNAVATKHISQVDSPTGTAVIVVDKEGENSIVVIPGANAKVTQSQINDFQFQIDDVLVSQFEVPISTIEAGFELAKQSGAKTILNPSPFQEIPKSLLDNTDFLVVNEIELAQATDSSIENDVDEETFENSAMKIYETGFNGCVITTLGSKGCFYKAGKNDRTDFVSAYKVDAVDTTGAGDCFTGNLASRISENNSLENAIQFAIAASALCVTKNGAGPSMPTKEETESFLNNS